MYKRHEKGEEKDWLSLKRKARRTHSKHASIAHFDNGQIEQFKEAFNLFDQDRDGEISKEDLKSILVSLGQIPNEFQLREMLEDISGPVDFAHFLDMFARRMEGADSEDLIKSAFACFDEDGDGFIDLAGFRELLTTRGLRLSDQQVDDVFLHETVTDSDGKFRCDDVVRLLKSGSQN